MSLAVRIGSSQAPAGSERERQLTRLLQGGPRSDAAPMRQSDAQGCPWGDFRNMLRKVGLRPTRQRMVLGWILFSRGNRHITAEMLYEEARAAKMTTSLATIYNTLHQFTEAGLLRPVAVEASKSFFNTNPSEHHHFFIEDDQTVADIPDADVALDRMPEPPPGYEIARVEVTVRLRRKMG